MNLIYFVRQRIQFVKYVHGSTVPPFLEIKRKIEAGEEPFVDRRYSEESDEPAFLKEWEDADVAADIIGLTCLGLLQTCLQSFLREVLFEIGGSELRDRVREMSGKHWMAKHRALFEEVLKIDWAKSGAELNLLEEMILTRNDHQHNSKLTSDYVSQSKDHSEKYGESRFRAENRPPSVFMPARLTASAANLEAVSAEVDRLCDYLEHARR